MPINQTDLELIERVIYKNGDDIAISMGRSFERLEERMDAIQASLNKQIDDLESVNALDRKDILVKFDALSNDITGLVAKIDDKLTELLKR